MVNVFRRWYRNFTTIFIENFIRNKKENQSDICAYAPLVFDHEIQISPTASDTLKMINFPKKPGIYSENLTGISSCLVVKSDLLIEIGGLNIEFPLDYLDHWLFWKIFNSNKR